MEFVSDWFVSFGLFLYRFVLLNKYLMSFAHYKETAGIFPLVISVVRWLLFLMSIVALLMGWHWVHIVGALVRVTRAVAVMHDMVCER